MTKLGWESLKVGAVTAVLATVVAGAFVVGGRVLLASQGSAPTTADLAVDDPAGEDVDVAFGERRVGTATGAPGEQRPAGAPVAPEDSPASSPAPGFQTQPDTGSAMVASRTHQDGTAAGNRSDEPVQPDGTVPERASADRQPSESPSRQAAPLRPTGDRSQPPDPSQGRDGPQRSVAALDENDAPPSEETVHTAARKPVYLTASAQTPTSPCRPAPWPSAGTSAHQEGAPAPDCGNDEEPPPPSTDATATPRPTQSGDESRTVLPRAGLQGGGQGGVIQPGLPAGDATPTPAGSAPAAG